MLEILCLLCSCGGCLLVSGVLVVAGVVLYKRSNSSDGSEDSDATESGETAVTVTPDESGTKVGADSDAKETQEAPASSADTPASPKDKPAPKPAIDPNAAGKTIIAFDDDDEDF